jgi:hypothetical protein
MVSPTYRIPSWQHGQVSFIRRVARGGRMNLKCAIVVDLLQRLELAEFVNLPKRPKGGTLRLPLSPRMCGG